MNIHEYQGKEILKKYGVRIQEGIVAESPEKAVEAAKLIMAQSGQKFVVVKSQIHAGGRGKGQIVGSEQRGVALAKSVDAVRDITKNLIGNVLVTHPDRAGRQAGQQSTHRRRCLLSRCVGAEGDVRRYFARPHQSLQRYHGQHGRWGMDIEEVAEHTPEKIVKEWIDPAVGLQPFQARKVAFGLGLRGRSLQRNGEVHHLALQSLRRYGCVDV